MYYRKRIQENNEMTSILENNVFRKQRKQETTMTSESSNSSQTTLYRVW